jgi:hypothetical protein
VNLYLIWISVSRGYLTARVVVVTVFSTPFSYLLGSTKGYLLSFVNGTCTSGQILLPYNVLCCDTGGTLCNAGVASQIMTIAPLNHQGPRPLGGGLNPGRPEGPPQQHAAASQPRQLRVMHWLSLMLILETPTCHISSYAFASASSEL